MKIRKTRVAINGFGRIGRQAARIISQSQRATLELVAVNNRCTDPAAASTDPIGDSAASPCATVNSHTAHNSHTARNAHLFKYDSSYGPYAGHVRVDGADMLIDGQRVKVLAESDPARLPWGELGIDVVIESSGQFTSRAGAEQHLRAGAHKIVISAPATGVDQTLVMGVNEHTYDPQNHQIVSAASCTTTALAPIARVLQDRFGIEKGILTAVHGDTSAQSELDYAASELRQARAMGANIIPAETGAARAIGLVIPELLGKFSGMALRVPTSTVSVLDFTAVLSRSVTVEQINNAMREHADGPLRGLLRYSDEPLISNDLKGDRHAAIFSAPETQVIGGNLIKVLAWYDNEWGYSTRLVDLVCYIASRLPATAQHDRFSDLLAEEALNPFDQYRHGMHDGAHGFEGMDVFDIRDYQRFWTVENLY